jgi:hypothetical protein
MTGPEERGEHAGRWALVAILAAAAYALAVAWTGGFDLRLAGIRVRSHDWVRPACVAVAGALWLAAAWRRRLSILSTRAWNVVARGHAGRVLAGAAAVWTIAAALLFGTFAVGGADSYGYAGQARLMLRGRLTDTIPLDPAFRWPDARASLIPLGFTGGGAAQVIAPRYPPGLPLLMVPFAGLSAQAIYLVVPLCGVLAVWCIYRLGAGLGDPLAGGAAALLLSASPTFLYQLVQPMGDVPVTACWLAALVAASRATNASAGAAGALTSLAIAIRPNLAPLAVVILVLAMGGRPERGFRRAAMFVAALAPGLVALGWVQHVRYGSIVGSGYGRIEEGFSVHNVLPNLARYPRWLTETHTIYIWLGALAPLWVLRWRRTAPPLLAWTMVVLALAVWAAYLPYVYFQPREWFYTRFLLPGIAIMLLFASLISLTVVRTFPAAMRFPAGALLLGGLLAACIHAAAVRQVFDLRAQERKYPDAGAFARERLPREAFILAAQHSGSLRYYASRPTLRWDVLAAAHLDEAIADLRAAGYQPFAVLDADEDAAFRSKFEGAGQREVQTLRPLAVLGVVRVYEFGR